jgi:hypothetical protein
MGMITFGEKTFVSDFQGNHDRTLMDIELVFT